MRQKLPTMATLEQRRKFRSYFDQRSRTIANMKAMLRHELRFTLHRNGIDVGDRGLHVLLDLTETAFKAGFEAGQRHK